MNVCALVVFLSWILMTLCPTHTEGLRLWITGKEMGVKRLYSIPVVLALCHVFYEVTAQRCSEQEGEKSIFGMMLQRHIFKRITGATFGDVCLRECYRDVRCQSFNYVISQDMCELNNRTKEARPEHFVADPERYYFTRDWKREMLGSIPELPAETCKEIKASEGGQAVSGKYWFDSIMPGETVLAHCDMEKEDVDECTASVLVCDVNADCKNTRGSYRCSCKAGFTGDRKTCTDLDECNTHNHNCDVNADCVNTVGSYSCKCKVGFTGDGQTCNDIDECSVGQICDVNANCQNTLGSFSCSCKEGFYGNGKTCTPGGSCQGVLQSNSAASDGTYQLPLSLISAYCDMTSAGQGWTLIARFSNDDANNWMNDTGHWWYDKNDAFRETSDPSINADMISSAFWLVSGNEFKITRSDDSQHTPLLQTTGNCLGGQTFRSKVTSYGDFRNGAVWASDQCLGSCTIQYGGQYLSTGGFVQATCSGEIQGSQAIGFWCDWNSGDGAVLMIGGGGTSCSRADHGIGVTEANEASFVFSHELDFGNNGGTLTQGYSLNLWIR